MSLLEDIFLQDEANEAQELERVIEGDGYDERPRSPASNSDENSAKEDEAEEDKRRVDPASAKTKRVIKNPRFVLNPARLTGPRGIEVIPDHFKDFKFKGKGHEREDLDLVLKKLEHWAYRLYPKFGFEDCIKKIETLGKKRPVMVHLQKIRSDQLQPAETVVQRDSSDDEPNEPPEEDEFDKLLQQQIELARATPAPESAKKPNATPRHVMSPFTMPKATSSPSISEEQKERMQRNRKLAEERRLARLKQNSSNEETQVETVKLHTLHEKLSNDRENSDSSDEERNVSIQVAVEVNTNNKTAESSNGDDEVTNKELFDHQDASIINARKITTDKTVNMSENTLNADYEIHDEISEIQKDGNNRLAGEVNVNIDGKNNTTNPDTMDVLSEEDEVPKREHKEINDDNPKIPEIMKDANTSVAEVNTLQDTEFNASIEEEPVMNASHELTLLNNVTNETIPKNKENLEIKVGAGENNVHDNPGIDQLVENELMDVDFDDDF